MSLIDMSILGSILIIGIIILRALLIHRLPKQIWVTLWLIAMIRLLIPVLLPLDIPGIGSLTNQVKIEWKSIPSTAQETGHAPNIEASQRTTDLSETTVVESLVIEEGKRNRGFFVWALGVFVITCYMIRSYVRDKKLLKEAIPTSKLEESSREIGLYKILISDRIRTPITYGILNSVIILPKEIELQNKELLRYVLQHERVHIKYHDNLFKLIALVTLCVHWYNPLVWVMWVLCQRDIELRCDEKVLHTVGAGNKKEYALTLLSMVEQSNHGFTMGVGFGKKAIKERMEAIMKYRKATIIGAFVAAIVITASLTVFVTADAQGTSSQGIEYAMERSETNGNEGYPAKETTASVEYAGTTKEREELYAPYKEAGISYDKEADRLLYRDKKIKTLLDKEKELIYTVPDGEGYFAVTYPRNTIKIEEITQKDAQKIEKVIYKKQKGLGGVLPKVFSNEFSMFSDTTTLSGEKNADAGTNTVAEEEGNQKLTKEKKHMLQEYADRFAEYGISVEMEDTDYQFYYKEEAVCFVADNEATDGSFSGTVYANGDHGTKGAVTIRNGKGEITGMKLLSEEETKEYNDKHW